MNADDEATARIRAADPASGHVSDLDALRRAVDARIDGGAEASGAASAPEQVGDAAEPIGNGTDELAARRARRGRRNAWLAGVAASVVVGMGGYLVGVNAAGAGAGDSAAEGSVADSAGAEGGGDEEAQLDSDDAYAESDGADSTAAEEGAADTMLTTSRAEFVASGLSEDPGTAEAFAYDPTGIASATTAEEIATALGVAGDAVEQDGAWTVTGEDGRVVQVFADGVASMGYSDPALDPGACAAPSSELSDPDSGDLGACPTDEPADPVATAQDFLVTIGVDVDQLELVVDYADGGLASVGGYVSGVDRTFGPLWTVTVVTDGVYSASGGLAPRSSLGSYDVVSAAAAVERLMDPRFGASPSQPDPASTGVVPEGGDTAVPPSSPGAAPEPGSPIPWPVETYTITDAVLVLGSYTLPDGAVALLPTWSLSSSDGGGGTWTVVAVAEGALDFDAGLG